VPRIRFEPMRLEVECAEGESLFEVARRNGVPVATACVAKANCGLCRMKILSGEENLSPLGPPERKHLGNVYYLTKERLSCQARVLGGEVVALVPIERLGRGPTR